MLCPQDNSLVLSRAFPGQVGLLHLLARRCCNVCGELVNRLHFKEREVKWKELKYIMSTILY